MIFDELSIQGDGESVLGDTVDYFHVSISLAGLVETMILDPVLSDVSGLTSFIDALELMVRVEVLGGLDTLGSVEDYSTILVLLTD